MNLCGKAPLKTFYFYTKKKKQQQSKINKKNLYTCFNFHYRYVFGSDSCSFYLHHLFLVFLFFFFNDLQMRGLLLSASFIFRSQICHSLFSYFQCSEVKDFRDFIVKKKLSSVRVAAILICCNEKIFFFV